MSKASILTNLHTSLQKEVCQNDNSDDSIAFLNTLVYNKHDKNSDLIRNEIVQSFSTSNQALKSNLSQYSDIITREKFRNDLILQDTKQSSDRSKTRRLSVDFEGDLNDDLNDDLDQDGDQDEDENVSQLRKRLLQGGRSKSEDQSIHKSGSTFDEKLNSEELKQEHIMKDMLMFIKDIKAGADAFNAKLSEDQNVLKAAEAGLDVTSKKMSKTRNNLSKTIASLGLFDALKIFGLVILLFFLSLIVIKIFPKW